MKARLISVLLVIALLVTVGIITAQAKVLDGRPSSKTTAFLNSAADSAFTQTITTEANAGNITAMCHVCGANRTWMPLDEAIEDNVVLNTANVDEHNHWYVPVGGLKNNSATYVISAGGACVHLNGQDIVSDTTAFQYGNANSEGINIMGAGNVTTTSNDPTYTIDGTGSAGKLFFFGGNHHNTGGGVVVKHGTGYLRFLVVAKNTYINGTLDASAAGSVRVIGGKIEELIPPKKGTESSSNYFILAGEPTINSLSVNSTLRPDVSELSGGTIKIANKGQVTGGFTEEKALTYAGYFSVVNPLQQIKVLATDGATTKYYVAVVDKEGVVTCKGCGEPAIFTELASAKAGPVATGHYKLTGNWVLDGPLTVAADVCVDLNGHDITSEGLVLKQTAGTVNIFGETGTVTGASTDDKASTIEVTGGNVTLKDCTIKHTSATKKPTLYIVGSGIVAKLNGITLTADEGVEGRNLYTEKATMEISNCLIENGNGASYGGNIYNESTDITFSDTIVRNGTAESRGGNIYTATGTMLYKSGTQILSVLPEDITETTAYTAANGGSIYHRSGTSIFEEGSVVSGGYAKNNGGSIYVYAGSMTFNGGTFTGGQAERGSFLAQVPDNEYSQNNSAVNVCGGTFYEGTLNSVADRGKTILVRGGKLTVTGGTFNSTSDGSDGKEIGCAINIAPTDFTAELVLTESTNKTIAIPEIVINDQYPGNAIRISSSEKAKLTVTSRFNDDIVLRYEGLDYGEVAGVYTPVKNVDYTGSVVVSNPDLNRVPLLHDGNKNLVVANVKVGDAWYTAQQAYENEEISEFQLLGDATLTVAAENNTKVDLNGKNITVDGTGAFNAYNSTSAKAGVATLGAGVTTGITNGYSVSNWVSAAHGGYYNIAIEQANEEGKIASYHKLEMAMKNISLRTGDVGLYYTSEIKADETLAAMINSAGVLLGATNEGGQGDMANLMLEAKASDLDKTDGAFRGVGIENPDLSKVTSVLVKNIFKAGATNNAERGKVRIVGTPYVKFVTGDVLVCQDVVDYSMKQFLDTADAQITDQTKLGALKNFCDTWNVASFGWTLPNILGTAPAEPEV